jgi:hypothetical protein
MWVEDCFSHSEYIASSVRIINEKYIGNDVEVSCREPIWGNIPQFSFKDWRKPRRISITMFGAPAKIRAETSKIYMSGMGNDIMLYMHRNSPTHILQSLKMEAVCISETSAMSPATTLCNNPWTELTSIINHRENPRGVIQVALAYILCLEFERCCHYYYYYL